MATEKTLKRPTVPRECWIWLGLALFGLLVARSFIVPPKDNSLSPITSISVHFDRSEHGKFADQMRKFGATFGFRVVTRNSSPDPDDVFFQMWRHDIDVSASMACDPGARELKYHIAIYPKWFQPVPPREDVEPVMDGLRRFLDEVPGMRITTADRQ